MITYINKNADVKNFNTWALSVNRTMKQKELSINRQIAYLERVYRSYVKHYNELQDLQKHVDSLTGESRYTSNDYSHYPAMDISATFTVNFGNVRLVNNAKNNNNAKKDDLVKFKNCIEDVRKNMLDVQLEIREVYNRVIREADPYGEMYKKTNEIRDHGSSISTGVAVNVSTALSEGDLTTDQYQEIKELAERETDEKEKTLDEPDVSPDTPDTPSKEDLEREAKEAAEKAFNEEQDRLDKAATDAANRANEANDMASKYDGSFDSHKTGNDTNWSYTDPSTGETFGHVGFGDTQTSTYSDGTQTITVTENSDGTYTVRDSTGTTTYDSKAEAIDAANASAGKDVFNASDSDLGASSSASGTYDSSKEKAEAEAEKANQEAKDAASAAKEHQESGSSDSSGGT